MRATLLMRNVAHMNNATPSTGHTIITTAEAAQMTGRSVATINRWVETGLLPVALKGPGPRGANFYRLEDVQEMMTYE